MAGTRIEKYREYRQSIAKAQDSIPVLKTPVFDENTASAVEMPKNSDSPLEQFWKWLTGQE
jgi:hypothetical protein